MTIVVRAYTSSDLAAVHTINEAEAPAVGSVTPERMAHIAAESAIALVAVDAAAGADAVAGFALVLGPGADYDSDNYAWFAARYPDFVYLDRVAVAPTHRRRGVGRALYDAVAAAAPSARPAATDWVLEVNLRPRNDTSLAFHAAMGFREVGQHESRAGYLVSMMSRTLAIELGTA